MKKKIPNTTDTKNQPSEIKLYSLKITVGKNHTITLLSGKDKLAITCNGEFATHNAWNVRKVIHKDELDGSLTKGLF